MYRVFVIIILIIFRYKKILTFSVGKIVWLKTHTVKHSTLEWQFPFHASQHDKMLNSKKKLQTNQQKKPLKSQTNK